MVAFTVQSSRRLFERHVRDPLDERVPLSNLYRDALEAEEIQPTSCGTNTRPDIWTRRCERGVVAATRAHQRISGSLQNGMTARGPVQSRYLLNCFDVKIRLARSSHSSWCRPRLQNRCLRGCRTGEKGQIESDFRFESRRLRRKQERRVRLLMDTAKLERLLAVDLYVRKIVRGVVPQNDLPTTISCRVTLTAVYLCVNVSTCIDGPNSYYNVVMVYCDRAWNRLLCGYVAAGIVVSM